MDKTTKLRKSFNFEAYDEIEFIDYRINKIKNATNRTYWYCGKRFK